jgi:hypothetical protein
MRLYLYLFSFLITSVMMISCTQDETCRENKDVRLNAGFFTSGTTNALSVDSLTVFGLGNDSMLYNVNNNINNIKLPLNKKQELSIFVMNFQADQATDTLFVLYTNQDYFISYECGSVITHRIDTVITTEHFIKSVKIINHDINTTDVQHLQIFH